MSATGVVGPLGHAGLTNSATVLGSLVTGLGNDGRTPANVVGLDAGKPSAEVSRFDCSNGFRAVAAAFVVCADVGDADRLKEEVAAVEKGLAFAADLRKGFIAGV